MAQMLVNVTMSVKRRVQSEKSLASMTRPCRRESAIDAGISSHSSSSVFCFSISSSFAIFFRFFVVSSSFRLKLVNFPSDNDVLLQFDLTHPRLIQHDQVACPVVPLHVADMEIPLDEFSDRRHIDGGYVQNVFAIVDYDHRP